MWRGGKKKKKVSFERGSRSATSCHTLALTNCRHQLIVLPSLRASMSTLLYYGHASWAFDSRECASQRRRAAAARPYLSCCLLPAEGHLSKAIGQELDHTVILCKQHPLSVTARPNKDWFLSQKRLHASLKNDTVYEQRDRIVFRRNFTSRRSLFQGFPNDSLGPFLWPTLRSCVCLFVCAPHVTMELL